MTTKKLPINIICNASLLPHADRRNAQLELESTFRLSKKEAEDFLDGNLIFNRSVENEKIALQYKKLFNKIGLQCTIKKNIKQPRRTRPALRLVTDENVHDYTNNRTAHKRALRRSTTANKAIGKSRPNRPKPPQKSSNNRSKPHSSKARSTSLGIKGINTNLQLSEQPQSKQKRRNNTAQKSSPIRRQPSQPTKTGTDNQHRKKPATTAARKLEASQNKTIKFTLNKLSSDSAIKKDKALLPINTSDELTNSRLTQSTSKAAKKGNSSSTLMLLVDNQLRHFATGSFQRVGHKKSDATMAMRAIYVAIFFYVLALIPALHLLNWPEQNSMSMDITHIPLLLGTIFITLSCFYLSRIKGYPTGFTALGLGGPIGLGITLLLPDIRTKADYKLLDKSHMTAFALIAVGVVWLSTPEPTPVETQSYLQQAQMLAEGRNTYPSRRLDDIEIALFDESIELQNYLDKGVDLIKQVENEPEKIKQISDAMFREVSKLLEWLHYQKFLSHQSGDVLHTGEGDDRIHVISRTIIESIKDSAKRLGNSHFDQQLTRWLAPSTNPPTGDLQLLYSELVDMKLQLSRSGDGIDENFSLDQFQLPSFSSAGLKVKGNILTLQLTSKDPLLSGESIVVAFYTLAYQRRGITGFDIVIEQIGGTVPNHMLAGQLNYFANLFN